MMAGIAIGGQGVLAVAVQTRAHGMGRGRIRGGVALRTRDAVCRVAGVVKAHVGR